MIGAQYLFRLLPPRKITTAMHDHHNLDGIGPQPVNDAVALVNHFADANVIGFGHGPVAMRKLWQVAGGVQQTFYVRPDGFRIVTETDRNGRMLRRFRRGPDGREHAIIDNRRFWRNVGIGVGVGALVTIVALNLRPPVVTIPRDRYIMDYERASDDDLYQTLIAEPVERSERVYSLEEVRYNPELRDRVRRVDLDTITFDFGSFEITPAQYGKLERLAKSINRVLADNPDAVFLIEGHTDAVGSQEDNLSLSDRRAQSVAQVLTEQFGVPPENLTTQGYGEQFLKVPTQDAERLNRRVAVRNISKLVAEDR